MNNVVSLTDAKAARERRNNRPVRLIARLSG